jgi:drug/metabolite transporter (DMT)-like permease
MTWWWLPLAAVAYLIFSVTGAVDKTIVTNKLKNPLVVSFWISLFGVPSAAILLVGLVPAPWAEPFRFQMPSLDGLVLITAAGITLQLTLLLSYMALKHGEATRVVPTIGAASPAFALIFAYLILDERLPVASYLAFGLLLLGAVLISLRPGRWGGWWFWLALASGAAGAFQSVLVKIVYGYNHFISSLALLGLGNVVFCLVLLALVPAVRREVAHTLKPKPTRKPKKRLKRLVGAGAFWLFLNNLLGSVGVIILNLSLKLGPVSLVNAMKGLQYVGVFVIAILLARSHPKLLREELSAHTVTQKLLAIGVIGLGVGLLVVTAS